MEVQLIIPAVADLILSKRHIAVVMLWETVYTCLITVVGGLLLGILLSKLMLLLLYKILFFSVSFGFMVSWKSVGITAVLFVAIYLVALLLNLLHVHLSKPVDLNALEQTLQRFRYEPSAEQPQ